MPCSFVQLARVVVVRVILVDVICVMLVVLIAHVECCSCCRYSFRSHFSVVEDVLFTPAVGDSELR